jgi:peptidoglycan/xylan/chitin deacetylase (PgdA/CDA1 family)
MSKKSHDKHKYFFVGIITGIAVLAIIIVGIIAIRNYMYNQQQSKIIHPVLETKKTEAKDLPEDLKKQLKIASSTATLRVPILLYHYVEIVQNPKDTMRIELNIQPTVFEQQVKTLADARYTFMTAKDLGDVLDGKTQMPEKPVLLTFDDGHWDLATSILPILKKYHAKATAYVIPGFIGGSDFMTSQQLQEVINSGLVDVGAHTVHHISLKGRPLAVDQYEVDQSKTMLEQTYHIKVVSFAYPYGTFDQQAVQVVKNDNFTTAVSTATGIEQNQANRFFLYRLRPGYRTGQILLTYLSQNYFRSY